MIDNTFIQSPEYQDYLDNKEQISPESVVFVEDKERLITQGKEYQFVPSNGKEGQILYKTEDGYEWKDNEGGVTVTEDNFNVTEMRIVEIEDSGNSNGNSNSGSGGGSSDVYVLPEIVGEKTTELTNQVVRNDIPMVYSYIYDSNDHDISSYTKELQNAIREKKRVCLEIPNGNGDGYTIFYISNLILTSDAVLLLFNYSSCDSYGIITTFIIKIEFYNIEKNKNIRIEVVTSMVLASNTYPEQ